MVFISAEKKAEYLHELMALQHFISSAEEPVKIETEVYESSERIEYEREEGLETGIAHIFDYNLTLAKHVPKISSFDRVDVERLCRNRISIDIIKKEILDKHHKFFSKVDKYIFFDGNDIVERLTASERSVVTISSNYSYDGKVISIHTAITVNTIKNYKLPTLQQLLAAMSI